MKPAAAVAALLLFACSGSSKPAQKPVGNQPDEPGAGDVIPARTDAEHAETQVAMAPGSDPRAPTGWIGGTVRDHHGEVIIGSTVVAVSDAMPGEQAVITDENGNYELESLPPGQYAVTFFYSDHKFEAPKVTVAAGQRTQLQVSQWDIDAPRGEIIIIK